MADLYGVFMSVKSWARDGERLIQRNVSGGALQREKQKYRWGYPFAFCVGSHYFFVIFVGPRYAVVRVS